MKQTCCNRIVRIRANNNLDKNLQRVLAVGGTNSMRFSKPISEMKLSRDYKRIAKEIYDCGGYTGHCSCLNNACMMCTAFH